MSVTIKLELELVARSESTQKVVMKISDKLSDASSDTSAGSQLKNATFKFAGLEIKRSCHACAFFHSDDEYYDVLLPFMKEGFETGDKTLHIVDQCDHDKHTQRLQNAGIQTDALKASGQFELKGWQDSYLQPGHFSQDAMIELVEETLSESKAKGYPMARLVGKMEWACQHDVPGVKDIVKYEARLNHHLAKYNDVVVCCYDINKHSASTVMDVLRTHPYVLIGGTMHENPYFVNPDDLLAELEARG